MHYININNMSLGKTIFLSLEWRCLTFLDIALMSHLRNDIRILKLASVVNLLQYGILTEV